MKIKICTLALAAAYGLIAHSGAGTTATEAIATLKKAEGTNTTDNIIGLTGRFGQDQPQEWEILAWRGNHFAMFIVDADAVTSITKIRTKTPTKLATEQIKCDSSEAFRIADKAAKKASVGFDSLNYSLKPRSDAPAPVWIVKLADNQGLTVGEIHIASESGSVLKSNWDRQQLNRQVRRSAPSTGATRGILADRRDSSVQTGTTVDGMRDGIANVSHSIRNLFGRNEVSNPNQSQAPKTTKTRPQ